MLPTWRDQVFLKQKFRMDMKIVSIGKSGWTQAQMACDHPSLTLVEDGLQLAKAELEGFWLGNPKPSQRLG